ncbi:MAG: DUF3325 domain-containing protein [Methylobacterium frigidaeris]
MTAIVVLLNLGLGLAGLGALRLSLARHHDAVFAVPLARRRALAWRAGGWVAIALSLAVAVRFEGWDFGPVQWLGTLTAAALALVVVLSYHPRLAWWLVVLPLLSSAALLTGLSAGGP